MKTYTQEEIQKFSAIADEWWDKKGKFAKLHEINKVRLSFIRDLIQPLVEPKVLDVGCGGGLISEEIAKLGLSITSIDASEENIAIASLHAEKQGLDINYIRGGPEDLDEKFDVIIALEVIEHTSDPELFLKTLAERLNKNGILILSTLNKTIKSFLLGIVAAEYILSWVPRGTHDWQEFIKPSSLLKIARKYALEIKSLKGISYNLQKADWELSDDIEVNYIASFKKI